MRKFVEMLLSFFRKQKKTEVAVKEKIVVDTNDDDFLESYR